jgi:hypothetical protein
MRDSGKIITTARQDELDKLSEGINFAFSRQFTTLRQHWQHAALFSPLVAVSHWQTATVADGPRADGSRELITSRLDNLCAHRLAPAHLHIIVCCAHSAQTKLLKRPYILHQKRPHPPSRHTTAQHKPFTPFTPTHHTLSNLARIPQLNSCRWRSVGGAPRTVGASPLVILLRTRRRCPSLFQSATS